MVFFILNPPLRSSTSYMTRYTIISLITVYSTATITAPSGTIPRPRNSIFSDMQVLGSLSFFWKSQFFHVVFDLFAKMIVQNIFFRFGKKSNFLSFFYVLGRQEPVWLFSWSKTNSNWAPLEKWWRTKIFIVCQTPYFLLENQFYKISHYTDNKYQGSSNFWIVWPILEIQNAK